MKKLLLLILATTLLTTSLGGLNVFGESTFPRIEKAVGILVEFDETKPPITTSPVPNTYTTDKISWYEGKVVMDDEYYRKIMFDTSPADDGVWLKGSLRNYYRENSAWNLDIVPAEEKSGTENDGIIKVKLPYPHPNRYLYGSGAMYEGDSERIIRDVFEMLDDNDIMDFTGFDNNNDGIINDSDNSELHIVFFISSGFDGVTANSPANRSQALNMPTGITGDGKVVSGGCSFLNDSENFYVVSHELAHTMGAIDYYNSTLITPIQDLSLMANDCHLDAWYKIKFGYVQPTVINKSGIYTVNSIDPVDHNKYNILKIPVGDNEFFLVENRQASGFESSNTQLDGLGIAIWHVKERLGDKGAEIENIEIEKASTYRTGINYMDLLYPSPITGNNVFSDDSLPQNSKRFDGSASGVSITVNPIVSNSMTVNIKLPDKPENLKANPSGNNMVLSWNAVAGSIGYQIKYENNSYVNIQGVNTFTNIFWLSDKNKRYCRVKSKCGEETQAIHVRRILIGDANGDSAVSIDDFNTVRNHLMGISTLSGAQFVAADINSNNMIDSDDLAIINQYCLGIYDNFPDVDYIFIVYGDIDNDGLVTMNDRALISLCCAVPGQFSRQQLLAADINGDKEVSSGDLDLITRYVNGEDIVFPVLNIQD